MNLFQDRLNLKDYQIIGEALSNSMERQCEKNNANKFDYSKYESYAISRIKDLSQNYGFSFSKDEAKKIVRFCFIKSKLEQLSLENDYNLSESEIEDIASKVSDPNYEPFLQ